MFPDNISAADRYDSNFIFLAFFTLCTAVIPIVVRHIRFLFQRFVHRIRQRQRRAAWCVQLLVVVFFHDLDIKACR